MEANTTQGKKGFKSFRDKINMKILRFRVADYLDKFYTRAYEDPIDWEDELDEPDYHLFADEPTSSAVIIRDIKKRYEDLGLYLTSPHQFGFVPIGGNMVSYATDYILAGYYGHLHLDKEAIRDGEREAMSWLCKTVGYPPEAGGYFIKGSSVCMVHCIATAREIKNVKPDDYDKSSIYTTERAHMCVFRAMVVNGLGSCNIREIDYDSEHRMDLVALVKQIQKDKKSGIRPFLLIGILASTDCGTVDHLNAMSDIAKKYDMWFHVDGAIGGSFAQPEVVEKWKDGKNLSDSMAVSCHKGLGQPIAISGSLFREDKHKSACFSDKPLTMFEGNPLAEPSTFSSLAMYATLKVFGEDFMHNHMRKNLLLVNYVYETLKDVPEIECVKPHLNIVRFRVLASTIDESVDLTKKLEKEIAEDGSVFLSGCPVEHLYFLRVCCSAMSNHISGIDMAMELVRDKLKLDFPLLSEKEFAEKPWLQQFEKEFLDKDHKQKELLLDMVRHPRKELQLIKKITAKLDKTGEDLEQFVAFVQNQLRDCECHDEKERDALEVGQLGQLISQFIGHVPTLCELGAGSCEITAQILKFIINQANFPMSSSGILTGSDGMANVLAVRTAINEHVANRLNELSNHRYVIYQLGGEIKDIQSIMNLLGVEFVTVKTVKGWEDFRAQVAIDKESLFRPWLLFMSSCSLEDIEDTKRLSETCHTENIWFHVVLTQKASVFPWMKNVPDLGGISYADSLTIDLGGVLHIAIPIKCFLVRQKASLRDAVDTGKPSPYLPPVDPLAYQPYDYGIELSAPNRVFVVWFTLRVLGLNAIRELNGIMG